MKENRPILSISILISKTSDSVTRCLDSLETIRKELACELILVYTGANRRQFTSLERVADQVIWFDWCDDFSKARNAGLERATGEWFLYLDDDEWIENPHVVIDFFQSGNYRRYGYANYIQRNYFDPNYSNYTDSWVTRMVSLRQDVRFRSRIHEYFDPVYGEGNNLPMIVNHSGYIYETVEERKRRFHRNVPLLQHMMKEEPDNIRWGTQLAQECYAAEEWGMLVELCQKALVNGSYHGSLSHIHLFGTYYAGLVHGLIGLGRYQEAENAATNALEKKQYGQLFISCIHLARAEACYHLKLWKQAKDDIDFYFHQKSVIVQDKKQYARWQEALIVDATYDIISEKKAHSIRIGSCLACGQCEPLERNWRSLEWDQPTIYVFRPLLNSIAQATFAGVDSYAMKHIWKCIWKNQKLYEATIKETACILMDEKSWEMNRSAYHTFCMQMLREIYRPEILSDFPELLPEMAQRALQFFALATEQRGKMNVQGTINDFNAGMWQGYNYSVPGVHTTDTESTPIGINTDRYWMQRGAAIQTA